MADHNRIRATKAQLAEAIAKSKASIAALRAEAAMLREGGEDLEDEEMLRAARRLEAQASKHEQSIARAMLVFP